MRAAGARRLRDSGQLDAEPRAALRGSDPTQPYATASWVELLQVGIGADSADFAIVERLQPHDVVVTQDIGLASIVLGRGARAIGVRGHEYNPLTIDSMMFIRHEEKKVRRAGGRTKGPAAFEDDDRERSSPPPTSPYAFDS